MFIMIYIGPPLTFSQANYGKWCRLFSLLVIPTPKNRTFLGMISPKIGLLETLPYL